MQMDQDQLNVMMQSGRIWSAALVAGGLAVAPPRARFPIAVTASDCAEEAQERFSFCPIQGG